MVKIFDGHGDIWTDIAVQRLDKGETDVFRKRHYEKFKKGGVFGGIWVIWVDPPYDEENPAGRSEQIVSCMKDELSDAEDIILPVREMADFAKAKDEGKLAIVTGMEGASQVGDDIEKFDYFYHEVGVRDVMLTWNEENPLATGWIKDPDRGLTDLGKKAVKKITDLGMCLDVAHLNDRCFWDLMSEATGPVISSHSNSRVLCPIDRNLTDEMMKEIAKTGGLVGMNSIRQLVAEAYEDQDLDHLMRHFDHVAELIGIEHIGLGFDFDDYLDGDTLSNFIYGQVETPSCLHLETEEKACNFLTAMKERGCTDEEIEMVAYKNFFRVFRDVWKA